MKIAEIEFKREGRQGIVPVGTYLSDAAQRFGVRFDGECFQDQGIHTCMVVVESGVDHLSSMTDQEIRYFDTNERAVNERLGCQTKIVNDGDLVIMTSEKKVNDDAAKQSRHDEYRKEFAELPLEKKISELVQLESIAIGETVSFVLNSPYLVFDKVMDVMAGLGLQQEEQTKRAKRPVEHTADEKTEKKPRAKASPRSARKSDSAK